MNAACVGREWQLHQWWKSLSPVWMSVIPYSLHASITSSSLVEPPGLATYFTPNCNINKFADGIHPVPSTENGRNKFWCGYAQLMNWCQRDHLMESRSTTSRQPASTSYYAARGANQWSVASLIRHKLCGWWLLQRRRVADVNLWKCNPAA